MINKNRNQKASNNIKESSLRGSNSINMCVGENMAVHTAFRCLFGGRNNLVSTAYRYMNPQHLAPVISGMSIPQIILRETFYVTVIFLFSSGSFNFLLAFK